MTNTQRIAYAYRTRTLIDTDRLLVAVAASRILLTPRRWRAGRVPGGFCLAVPLTSRRHLIVGVSL